MAPKASPVVSKLEKKSMHSRLATVAKAIKAAGVIKAKALKKAGVIKLAKKTKATATAEKQNVKTKGSVHKESVANIRSFLEEQGSHHGSAASSTDLPPQSVALKRPAAAGAKAGALKRPAAAASGLDEMSRDRMKQYYFLKEFEALPSHVQKLWEEAKSAGKRDDMTKIVNNSMKALPKGYGIDHTAPIFDEMRSKFEKRFFEQAEHGVTRSVAAVTVGGEDKLRLAIESGEVLAITGDDGDTYYKFRSLRIVRQTGVNGSQTVSRGKNIDTPTYSKLCEALDSLDWHFSFNKKDAKAQTATPTAHVFLASVFLASYTSPGLEIQTEGSCMCVSV
jgi:hypothetical protein